MEALSRCCKEHFRNLLSFNLRPFLLQGTNLGKLATVTGYCGSNWELFMEDSWLVSAGLVVTSALIIWKSLILITGCESPVRCKHIYKFGSLSRRLTLSAPLQIIPASKSGVKASLTAWSTVTANLRCLGGLVCLTVLRFRQATPW